MFGVVGLFLLLGVQVKSRLSSTINSNWLFFKGNAAKKSVCEDKEVYLWFEGAGQTADVFVNGRPLKLMGVTRHRDYPGTGNALSGAMYVRGVELLKELGLLGPMVLKEE